MLTNPLTNRMPPAQERSDEFSRVQPDKGCTPIAILVPTFETRSATIFGTQLGEDCSFGPHFGPHFSGDIPGHHETPGDGQDHEMTKFPNDLERVDSLAKVDVGGSNPLSRSI